MAQTLHRQEYAAAWTNTAHPVRNGGRVQLACGCIGYWNSGTPGAITRTIPCDRSDRFARLLYANSASIAAEGDPHTDYRSYGLYRARWAALGVHALRSCGTGAYWRESVRETFRLVYARPAGRYLP